MNALENEGMVELRRLGLLKSIIRDAVYSAVVAANNTKQQYQSDARKTMKHLQELIVPYHARADRVKLEKGKKKLLSEVKKGPMLVKPMVYSKQRRRSGG